MSTKKASDDYDTYRLTILTDSMVILTVVENADFIQTTLRLGLSSYTMLENHHRNYYANTN